MKNTYYLDAGVEHLHLQKESEVKGKLEIVLDVVIKIDDTIEKVLKQNNLWEELTPKTNRPNIYVTGKLSAIIIKALGYGIEVMPAAAVWSAGNFLLTKNNVKTIGIIDLSASGYMTLSVNKDGTLLDNNLVVNARCGAGSGTNLSRILHKLDINKSKVDDILKKYIGPSAMVERAKVSVRADRCGVFSSSATISDKNQGIPLDSALAVTLKSEVLKAVKKVSSGNEIVCLTGRVFNWQFARECAEDYLLSVGIKKVLFDKKQSLSLDGLKYLIKKVGVNNFKPMELRKVAKEESMVEYPSFSKLLDAYTKNEVYLREKNPKIKGVSKEMMNQPVFIGLDIGSTMAKIVIVNALTNETICLDSYNNNGDTIETVKYIFRSLQDKGITKLNIQQIGVTGSGRYQVQKILSETYPHLRDRIVVLVENYAHARGSLQEAKAHIQNIKKRGEAVNEDYCLLVDVGGEDTKISIVSLKTEDLYDNAMNIKCSAGTGSLMDTLRSMFGLESVSLACEQAMTAKKSYVINATCAVFLIENARKLQAQGFEKKEILASCYWAIVENMSRTLWSQIDFPKNAVALLHGQTMLSDPLPLSVTHRLQEYTGSKTHVYVPPFPGHRACFGLIKGLEKKDIIFEKCDLSLFTNREFSKKIFICRGAACGDKNASCSRSMLAYTDDDGNQKFIPLGGCTTVNEFEARLQKKDDSKVNGRKDVYKDIWHMFDNEFSRSKSPNRLVIPRSFSISEHAFFFDKIFSFFNIPVYVDSLKVSDIIEAQPKISVDSCAPMVGAVGQFSRLSREEHGMIFIPQIDFLDTGKASLGRTCTVNQGGVVIAMNMAKAENPKANFVLSDISFAKKHSEDLAKLLFHKLEKVFDYYGKKASVSKMKHAIATAIYAENNMKTRLAETIAKELVEARAKKKPIVVVCGREYVLNPGIYDSHIGRLFSDKSAVVIPSYIFDGNLHQEFSAVYWRNPHQLLSIVKATKEKKLHEFTKNKKLSKILLEIESDRKKETPIGIVFVSTFRCGPDSMIIQTIQEIAKNIPFLVIQSDAAINELAHLENRVNTYLNQLSSKSEGASKKKKIDFKIEFLDKYSAQTLNKKEDAIYFPTLEDNRLLTATLRSAGYVCIDNYNTDTYNLQKLVKFGRRFTGDTVCAPFAAVFADTMLAVVDFIERKKRGELKDQKRVIVFNIKGTGPCRQGQYYEMHRLLLHRELENYISSMQNEGGDIDFDFSDLVVQYIVGQEKNNYDIGFEPWVLIQSFQGLVLQGVLHSVLFQATKVCNNIDQYEKYRKDILKLNNDVIAVFEKIKPSPVKEKLILWTSKIPLLNVLSLYYLSGIANNNGVRKILLKFSKKWKYNLKPNRSLKIYAEGEAYMRVAQIDEVFKNLIDDLGVGNFDFAYSPVWLYFEYLLEHKLLKLEELKKSKTYGIKDYFGEISIKLTVKMFRSIFVRPLYRSAGISEPTRMREVLHRAKEVLPTRKPYGELAPYVGEAIYKLDTGTELFLNIAPEGCMVATMGDMLTKSVYSSAMKMKDTARIQSLFSTDGEIDNDKLVIALLKILGPEKYYVRN